MKPIEDMEVFEQGVFEAYLNAVWDDWIKADYTAEDIALDMLAYDGTLEEFDDDTESFDEDMLAVLIPIIAKFHPHRYDAIIAGVK